MRNKERYITWVSALCPSVTTIILINSNRLSVKEIGDEVTFIALGFLVNPSFIILRYDWLFVMLLGFALTTQSKTIF